MKGFLDWIAVGLAFASLAPALASQEVPAAAVDTGKKMPGPAQVERKGRITGTVLCGDTHRPARGAMLMVLTLPSADAQEQNSQRSEVMTRAGMDGSFSAERLAPGEYTVIAFLPGYLSGLDDVMASEMGERDPARERALLAKNGTVVVRGPETERFDLVLARGAAVSGRVLYSDGSPATQVTIDLEDVKAKPEKSKAPQENMNVGFMVRTLFTHQSVGTDDQGRFRIAGLTPGTYRVAAVQSGANGLNSGGGDEGIGMAMGFMSDTTALHFYSGDTLHKNAAKTYELRAGDEVADIAITIPETLFHQVRGSVTVPGGKLPNHGTLTLKDASDETVTFSTTLGQDGGFLFPNVPPGTYTLSMSGAMHQNFDFDGTGANPDGAPRKPPLPIMYAGANMGVIVKDGDVIDVTLALKETAANETATPAAMPAPQL